MPESPKLNGPTSDRWANQIIYSARAAETVLVRLEMRMLEMRPLNLEITIAQLRTHYRDIMDVALNPPLPFE